jgi:hypothetical protein
LLGAGFVGDVDGKRLRAPTLISDRAGNCLGFVRIDVGNSDCGAFGREQPRDRSTDFAAAAGDKRHASR